MENKTSSEFHSYLSEPIVDWVVKGNTFKHRETLKGLGLWFDKDKREWVMGQERKDSPRYTLLQTAVKKMRGCWIKQKDV